VQARSQPTAAPTAKPTITVAPPATPLPTATETPEPPLAAGADYSLSELRHDNQCPGDYIMGEVVDPNGVPLEGVRVIGVDQWGNFMEATTEGGQLDAGRFNFEIADDSREYYVTVVDDVGAPLSFSVTIQHRMGDLSDDGCHHIQWQSRP
jgi:hypothetical protein